MTISFCVMPPLTLLAFLQIYGIITFQIYVDNNELSAKGKLQVEPLKLRPLKMFQNKKITCV